MKIVYSGAEHDPTHPDSPLTPRHTGDIVFRLVRKFGPAKGLRLFGYMLSLTQEYGVETMIEKQRLWEYTQDLKSCGLAPHDIKPGELGEWTKEWFDSGFNAGMLLGRLANPTPGGEAEAKTAN